MCRCSGGGGFRALLLPFSSDMMKSQKNIQYIHGRRRRRCLLHSGNRDEENEERSRLPASSAVPPHRGEKFFCYLCHRQQHLVLFFSLSLESPPPFGDSHRSPANFKLLIHIWSRLLLFSFFPLSARPRVRPWASSREKGSGGGERGRPPYEVFSPCLLWRERATSPSTRGDLDRMKDFLKTGKTAARGGGRRARGRKIPTEREEGQRWPQGSTVIPFISASQLQLVVNHPPRTAQPFVCRTRYNFFSNFFKSHVRKSEKVGAVPVV